MLQACEVTFSDAATLNVDFAESKPDLFLANPQASAGRQTTRPCATLARLRVLSRFRLLSDSYRHVRTHTTATLTL